MLQINENKGFHLKFENGLTISVQFGYGDYCDNRNVGNYQTEKEQDLTKCHDAEIAIWNEDGNWVDFGSDTIKGWVTADEVAEWIYKTKTATNISSLS